MKRICSFLMIFTMLASLLSGCGGSKQEETAQAAPEAVATTAPVEETEAPTTAPTLSPEEILYDSLPDRMKQAVDVGIVELSQLEDLTREATVGEVSAMLQKAYVHRTGVESKTLNELMNTPEYADLTADRGWIFGVPGQVDMEMIYGDNYKNYQQWMAFLNQSKTEPLWSVFDDRLGILDVGYNDDGKTYYITSFGGSKGEKDIDQYISMMGSGSIYGPDGARSYADIQWYACKVFDSTTGKRFFQLEDGYIHPTKPLTVEDAAEYALKFWNYPNPLGYPEFVAPETAGEYDPQIITPDLLTKETDLPEADCSRLPAEWHGVVMDDMVCLETNGHRDHRIYEYEIRAIKEAGFNYIGLELDFNWLQESFLFHPFYDSQKAAFKAIRNDGDDGKWNLDRLEQLDQVLAWCMQYDIHLNLRCVGVGGFGGPAEYEAQNKQLQNVEKYKDKLAVQWQAMARRYAKIPDTYLSFTLFTAPEMKFGKAQVKKELLIPSLEAIRAESPQRCVIVDVFNSCQDAEAFAQLGVALSYRMTKPAGMFNFETSDYYSYKGSKYFNDRGLYAVRNFTWPYQEKTDAEALLALPHDDGSSFTDVMEIARENGVGFMLSEFGVSDLGEADHSRVRYAEDAYHAMIGDITDAVEAAGYGWCFAHWYGGYGVTFCLPVIENAAYEQVEDYPYYVDKGMFDLFREINGVQ